MTDTTRPASRKKPGQPICGARTRRGTPCQCRPLTPGGRCRRHGGASTGPVTVEGKRQARANLIKARAVINAPPQAEVRRARALKGWETRRQRAKQARWLEIARLKGFPPSWLAILERVL